MNDICNWLSRYSFQRFRFPILNERSFIRLGKITLFNLISPNILKFDLSMIFRRQQKEVKRVKQRNREKMKEREKTEAHVSFFPTLENRYESYKLAVRSDVMVIYRTILREDSSSIGEYRYGIHLHPLFLSVPRSSSSRSFFPLPFHHRNSPLFLLPLWNSRDAREEGGQRSRWGFSGICRLKPPTGLVTTQFQLLGRYKKSKKSKREREWHFARESERVLLTFDSHSGTYGSRSVLFVHWKCKSVVDVKKGSFG